MLKGPSETTGSDPFLAHFAMFIDAIRCGAHRARNEKISMLLYYFAGYEVGARWGVVAWGKTPPPHGELIHRIYPKRKKKRTRDEILLEKRASV